MAKVHALMAMKGRKGNSPRYHTWFLQLKPLTTRMAEKILGRVRARRDRDERERERRERGKVQPFTLHWSQNSIQESGCIWARDKCMKQHGQIKWQSHTHTHTHTLSLFLSLSLTLFLSLSHTRSLTHSLTEFALVSGRWSAPPCQEKQPFSTRLPS